MAIHLPIITKIQSWSWIIYYVSPKNSLWRKPRVLPCFAVVYLMFRRHITLSQFLGPEPILLAYANTASPYTSSHVTRRRWFPITDNSLINVALRPRRIESVFILELPFTRLFSFITKSHLQNLRTATLSKYKKLFRMYANLQLKNLSNSLKVPNLIKSNAIRSDTVSLCSYMITTQLLLHCWGP